MILFTIATSDYKDFLKKYFIPTVGVLVQKVKLVIFSDGLEELNGMTMGNIENIEVIHTMDMPYPLVTLLKIHYLNEYVKTHNVPEDEEFIYADANGRFIKPCPFDVLKGLYFAISPHTFEEGGGDIVNNNRPNTNESHIHKKKYTYIQASLIMGQVSHIKKLLKPLNRLITNDLNNNINNRLIPNYADESYLNKIANDMPESIEPITFDYLITNMYLTPDYKRKEFYKKYPHIFVEQKMVDSKKRNQTF